VPNTKKSKRSVSQKKADVKYESSRAKKERLSGYLDDSDAKLLTDAAKVFGNKKLAVIGALKFWKKYKNKVD